MTVTNAGLQFRFEARKPELVLGRRAYSDSQDGFRDTRTLRTTHWLDWRTQ